MKRRGRGLRIGASALVAAFLMASLTGCARTFPGGAVPTDEDAVRLAERLCAGQMKGFPRAWHAALVDGVWEAWKPKSRLHVTIDARTGKTTGCQT